MEVHLRPAGLEDTVALAALRRRWAAEQVGECHGDVEESDDLGFEAEFAAWFARELDARRTWLAEVGEEPVGMLNMLVFTRMPKPSHPARRTWPGNRGYIANV